MNELIKYFEALEARMAAQDERIAQLESNLAEKNVLLQQMSESLSAMAKLSEDSNKNLLDIHRLIADGIQVTPEPEVDVELIYPEDEEATIELPEDEEPAQAGFASMAPAHPEPEQPETPNEAPAPVAPEEPAVEPEPADEIPAEEPVVEPATEPVVEPVVEQPKPEAPRAPQQTTLFGSPVSDIRQAVSIGDRFLFQRELFGGNAEKLQQTLTELNNLHSLDEAVAFVDRFGWDKQSPTYELFLNVLRRRFQ